MGERRRKPVTADKSAVIPKPFLDAIVMENGQRDGRFSDPSGTYESDWFEVFSKTDDLLN